MDYEHGLWIMALGEKELGRGSGLWHMDYASAWEEKPGLWIMSNCSSSQDEGGLWIMDYEPVNKTRLRWIMDYAKQ